MLTIFNLKHYIKIFTYRIKVFKMQKNFSEQKESDIILIKLNICVKHKILMNIEYNTYIHTNIMQTFNIIYESVEVT